MNDRPDAVELLGAVQRFLSDEIVPNTDGPRRFHARVAANVVGIVAREIQSGESMLAAEWERLGLLLGDDSAMPPGLSDLAEGVRQRNAALAERIRSGEADAGAWRQAVLAHLRVSVEDKLAVSLGPGKTS